MTILVIDGQGGAIGSQMVKRLLAELPKTEILAVGTNSIATASMLKSGAIHASTGENAVMTCAKRADIIVGPIGIVLADALMGPLPADNNTDTAEDGGKAQSEEREASDGNQG